MLRFTKFPHLQAGTASTISARVGLRQRIPYSPLSPVRNVITAPIRVDLRSLILGASATQPTKPTIRTFSSTARLVEAKNAPGNGRAEGAEKNASEYQEKYRIENFNRAEWEDKVDLSADEYSQLPHKQFGINQFDVFVSEEYKKALKELLRQFKIPPSYVIAYGSGVYPQTSVQRTATEKEIKAVHPDAPEAIIRAQNGHPKMIDLIFGVAHAEHWHSLNMRHNRSHYSGLASLGSGAVAWVQENVGAGVYFNPYVVMNGVLLKYGVVSLDTLARDLSEWDTMYLAGRLHKPVKILRDHPRVRANNHVNLLSAIRTALLLLPDEFTERQLYSTIASLSYLGDPRMSLPTENKNKVDNIVGNNIPNFRLLYAPLIRTMPNVQFNDPIAQLEQWFRDPEANLSLKQDMDPTKRANMVARLPKAFQSKLYFEYQKKYHIPRVEFNTMMEEARESGETQFKGRHAGPFEKRIVQDDPEELKRVVRAVIKKTISWPSTSQSLKSAVTAGFRRTARYLGEKYAKYQAGQKEEVAKQ